LDNVILLVVRQGTISEAGLQQNLDAGIGYIEAWLRGTGCVPLYRLMEDAATAEISRAKSGNGSDIAPRSRTVASSMPASAPHSSTMSWRNSARVPPTAAATTTRPSYSGELIEAPTFPEFLTLPAYEMITANIT
jgi:malate synthase